MKHKAIINGSTELMILLELAKKDRYAYDIQKVLKEDSNGVIDIVHTTLYAHIFKLKENGYISSYDILEKSKARVMLRIEPEGHEYLNELIKNHMAIHNVFLSYKGMNNAKENETHGIA